MSMCRGDVGTPRLFLTEGSGESIFQPTVYHGKNAGASCRTLFAKRDTFREPALRVSRGLFARSGQDSKPARERCCLQFDDR